jgi:hypothetical protein
LKKTPHPVTTTPPRNSSTELDHWWFFLAVAAVAACTDDKTPDRAEKGMGFTYKYLQLAKERNRLSTMRAIATGPQ